jgi:hypothetical protein
MERISRRPYDIGVNAHFDQRRSALDRISSFIHLNLISHERMHEWLTAAAESGRAIKGEEESGVQWIGVRDWDDLEDF